MRIILFGFIVLLLAGGGYWKHANDVKERQREIERREEAALAARGNLQKAFKALLDKFIRQMGEKARAYRAQRKAVTEMTKVENLGNINYVEENYRMMQAQLPELRKKMEDILAVFPAMEGEIQALGAGQPDEARIPVLASWEKLKQEQAASFLAFFESEQDIIKAYEDLMEFYRDKKADFVFEPSSESLVFKNDTDKLQEQALIARISELEALQAVILDQN